MSFYVDNNNYCIGRLCLHNRDDYCEHVVLNQGILEMWDIFRIRTELGYKITNLENKHFLSNKIEKSRSGQELELFHKYKN